ncbi:hypothetical protein TcasGA2_TC030979 [Tribolium castaneum]|uniref:Uncharacterized protein n=1 Tax=Tribolium castaneum TaxID=7070 RepID=A0A139W999_TRICA|nr:hypothetical protein TcasGA2_TC030979 [Tribolium castaneum]
MSFENEKTFRQRPYHAEYTSSRLITEVKQRRARLVLGWVTAWEHRVPLPPFLFYNALNKILGQLIYSEDEKTFKQRPYHAEYTSSRLITEVKQRRARLLIYSEDEKTFRQRPYHAEYTSSRLITEVKQRRARLVLGWVTAWEHRVPLPPFLFYNALNKILGQLIYSEDEKTFRQRPYHAEYTSSRLITEVKQRRARLVLGWVTAWEHRLIYSEDEKTFRQRPYHAEYTSSRLITEVKQRRARLVLGWVTAWEHRVPLPPFLFYNALNKILGQLMSFENEKTFRQRPYHAEYTSSRLITEVKQRRARLVLGWVTAWEHRVPLIYSEDEKTFRQRPYHAEYTSSRLITEVKQRRARLLIYSEDEKTFRQRPYHAEYTSSRLITEVKQRRARLVLGWVTAWEHRVPLPPFLFYNALNKILGQLIYSEDEKTFRQRPYHAEYTSSRLITEVKQRRARLVLGWVTAWEHRVPLPPFLFYNALNKILGQLIYSEDEKTFRQRPYHAEYTSSRLITEVKQRRARLVLGWVTAWEHRVPLPPFLFYNALNKILGQLIYSEDEKTFKQRPYHAEYTSSRLITEVKQRRARLLIYSEDEKTFRQRPYHAEYTSSRLITEVKQRRARLVLGWVTAWEHRVPLPPFLFYNALNKILGQLIYSEDEKTFRQRPYHAEYTSSRLITEVKQRRARLVLGGVTAWEHRDS